MLIVANSFIINPAVQKRNYDPLTSFEAVCLLTRSPNVVVVNNASPHRTLLDLINAARARPGDITMAFNGPATGQQIGYEKLKRAAGINMIPVTFPGAAPAVNALLGGRSRLFLSSLVARSTWLGLGMAREVCAAVTLRQTRNAERRRRQSGRTAASLTCFLRISLR